MNTLPEELENIILDYKFNLEYEDRVANHKKTFEKTLEAIARNRKEHYCDRCDNYITNEMWDYNCDYCCQDCAVNLGHYD